MKKSVLFVALPMMFAIALTGCSAPSTAPQIAEPETTNTSVSPSTPKSSSSTTATPEAKVAASSASKATEAQTTQSNTSAVDALNKLTVSNESGSDTYNRDNFNHWVSKNPSGCDTRFAVLVSESTTKTKISGCKVISGTWNSAYDGVTITDPKKLDIDHMVPLKEAWESGASAWDASKREAYANDLTHNESLVAVSAASNRAKSDRDPANWLPTQTSYRCTYVTNWISVKTNWKLAIDSAEKTAIANVLSNCNGQTLATTPVNKVAVPAPVPVKTITPNVPASVKPTVPATPVKAPAASTGKTDPDMGSCKAAKAAGYGPYTKGQPEYAFYKDGDGDGTVCE